MPLNTDEMQLLREVASLPTAPFCEGAVQAYVREWAGRNGIGLFEDQHGNMLLEYRGHGRQHGAPWVLQAHMDHPGFSFIKRRGKLVQAWFRGGVRMEYFAGAKMRFMLRDGDSVAGTVLSARNDPETGFLLCRIELERAIDLPAGTLGMWDIPPFVRKGDRLNLRVADDLVGVAAILLTLARLAKEGAARKCHGLLTRAEEVGFVGAISAAKERTIHPNWPVLGIECSKAQPSARIGGGAVVRVGDRSTIFDPDLTAHLRQVARDLHPLRFSESLMPGGSTESTALSLLGYRCCAVCLPLGNYHNMGQATGIAPEQIDRRDMESLLALLVHVVQRVPDKSPARILKKRLLENHRSLKRLL